MATLDSLAADVYTLTNRPDLVAETLVSLKKAIRKFHGAETFKRDLAVERIDMTAQTPLAANQYRWSLALSLFPSFRRFKAVNFPPELIPSYNTTPAPLRDWTAGFKLDTVFHEIAPDNLFDRYGYERQNYFFITGSTVLVKAGWYVDFLDFTYYKWPVIPALTSDPVTSWIVNEYPDCIVEEAAGAVFKMIGKDDEFNRFAGLFADNLVILKSADVGETA